MKKSFCFFSLFLFIHFGNAQAVEYSISGMGISIDWNPSGDQLIIQGTAKTQGWVGIGFNASDGILGADLKLLAFQAGELISSDRKTIGFGDYPEDISSGGTDDIQDVTGKITDGIFHFRFSIPINSTDAFDTTLSKDQELWIMLAYSEAPEFDHHSRIRKHLKFSLPYK